MSARGHLVISNISTSSLFKCFDMSLQGIWRKGQWHTVTIPPLLHCVTPPRLRTSQTNQCHNSCQCPNVLMSHMSQQFYFKLPLVTPSTPHWPQPVPLLFHSPFHARAPHPFQHLIALPPVWFFFLSPTLLTLGLSVHLSYLSCLPTLLLHHLAQPQPLCLVLLSPGNICLDWHLISELLPVLSVSRYMRMAIWRVLQASLFVTST